MSLVTRLRDPLHLIDAFQPADSAPPRTLWAFFAWCLRGSGTVLAWAALISAVAGTLEVFAALILGAVIDRAVASGTEGFFAENAGMLIASAAFFMVARPIAFGANAAANSIVIQPNLMPLVLSRLHRWTMGHAVRFFDDDFAGRISQKQMQAARSVTEITAEFINVICFALASIVGSVLLLLAIDGLVAGMLALWLVGYLLMIRWFLPRVRVRAAERAAARAWVSGQVVDTITNIKTVKLFAHAEHEDRAALGAMQGYRERAEAFGWLSAAFRLALMTAAGVLPVILVGAALILWSRGAASPGDIVAAGAISIRIAQMTGWVSFTLMQMYANLGEVEDGMNTLTPPHDLVDAPGAADLAVPRGRVAFDDVTFTYGRGEGGIRGVSLVVEPGQRVGVVGASGAGKSTLVSLLLRLYDAEGGRVAIDGQDVGRVTQESLRRSIALVTQETAMFNRSARDNIRYGRPGATDAEVEEAARRAEAHEFILSLRDFRGRTGYDAHLGERGVKLSGGQRQRVALARAILKDAPILVLDEATSALDSEVEAAIQSALERVMEGKTVLAIAHRLSTLTAMDRIVVMDEGRIVEDGTHETLLARGGLYARYWHRQSGGFLGAQEAAE